ncbi:serine--tRNA ligase [Candidatus Beckwithbacteria bacterium CG23_combo_of_CG06-09_8_20_14_all_47_9]|uniref:Serine--tRNA ligase n=1 Tax=Candidatus Beckwithbacteria bacterium CG23_combo_of_CG06-09_8_20_14_all_47_9 TaxID=1974498 RepID=A0A2H0B4Q3_9BACT|nr:MAG: serine--tRNA ligase [Candidatus Beckwithbacteria bacterium CG23_combo_of_CG06-09_8_20_14_all_47_9]
MLDLNFIRDNPDQIKQSTKDKGFDPKPVDQALTLDKNRRDMIGKTEALRARRNQLTKNNIDEGKKIKAELKQLEPELKETEIKLKEALWQIPNPASAKAPLGKNEKDNVEVKKWGEIKKFDFTPKDHLELGKNLGILDFESGAKVAGSQFYFWYGAGARLELALIQYAFDVLEKEGFKPVITPDLAKSRYYLGTGYIPKGKEAQTYEIKDQDLGLIATAEVTLAAKHADEIIEAKNLPIKYIGYSHCFRQEQGAYGKYSKGLYRVHEFTKAEMFIYCLPEESDKWHEHLLAMEEKIYQGLNLPYRVLEMCTGDLGAMAARKFDIEAWMPSRNEYGEVTSTSNCTDYQARNLNIKFRRKGLPAQAGKTEYVHMLNGTAIATSRAPLAILENYQQKDGSVKIPEVLQPYVGKTQILP